MAAERAGIWLSKGQLRAVCNLGQSSRGLQIETWTDGAVKVTSEDGREWLVDVLGTTSKIATVVPQQTLVGVLSKAYGDLVAGRRGDAGRR